MSETVHCLREEIGENNPTHYAYSREKIWTQRWSQVLLGNL